MAFVYRSERKFDDQKQSSNIGPGTLSLIKASTKHKSNNKQQYLKPMFHSIQCNQELKQPKSKSQPQVQVRTLII